MVAICGAFCLRKAASLIVLVVAKHFAGGWVAQATALIIVRLVNKAAILGILRR
jgi:hypothetical protein